MIFTTYCRHCTYFLFLLLVKEMKPMTLKQRDWWDSLGRRSKHESKANVKTRKEIRQLTGIVSKFDDKVKFDRIPSIFKEADVC